MWICMLAQCPSLAANRLSEGTDGRDSFPSQRERGRRTGKGGWSQAALIFPGLCWDPSSSLNRNTARGLGVHSPETAGPPDGRTLLGQTEHPCWLQVRWPRWGVPASAVSFVSPSPPVRWDCSLDRGAERGLHPL